MYVFRYVCVTTKREVSTYLFVQGINFWNYSIVKKIKLAGSMKSYIVYRYDLMWHYIYDENAKYGRSQYLFCWGELIAVLLVVDDLDGVAVPGLL
jgi:hypothetical protein